MATFEKYVSKQGSLLHYLVSRILKFASTFKFISQDYQVDFFELTPLQIAIYTTTTSLSPTTELHPCVSVSCDLSPVLVQHTNFKGAWNIQLSTKEQH